MMRNPRSIPTLCEQNFPLRDWLALRAGDVIRMRRSKTLRRIVRTSNKPGSIVLYSERTPIGTTTYATCDRYMFEQVTVAGTIRLLKELIVKYIRTDELPKN